uniref:Potassium channel domain-containing protein n=2 Tax=Clytia hemisphaerica TaxID=252671 RepID=A0A7M5XA44_9CNID
MSVENQILTLAELTSLVKQNLKRCFVFCLISVSLMLLGGLLFFYIEHCATTTKTIISKQQQGEVNCIKLCDQLIKYRNETHEIPSLVNLTATCSVECKVPVWRRECELNRAYFFMWTEYAMTVATTIGYGRFVAKTDLGKIMTIIYAIFTVPLTMAALSLCVSVIKYSTQL